MVCAAFLAAAAPNLAGAQADGEELAELAEKGELPQAELETIRHELDELAARGQLTRELRAVRDRLAMLQTPAPLEAPREKPQPAQSERPGQPGGAL